MTEPFVMLVDDEVSLVETLAKRLEKRNVKTIAAFSGEECLETLKANQNLDVIVLDVKMPGMDGIETLKQIKKTSPLTEVIMLTGNATIQLAIDGMKQGAYDFLMKPCDIEDITSKVKEAAEKKRAHEEKIKEALKQETLSKYGSFYYT
jgi:DNA-binding NtrC family response regulator